MNRSKLSLDVVENYVQSLLLSESVCFDDATSWHSKLSLFFVEKNLEARFVVQLSENIKIAVQRLCEAYIRMQMSKLSEKIGIQNTEYPYIGPESVALSQEDSKDTILFQQHYTELCQQIRTENDHDKDKEFLVGNQVFEDVPLIAIAAERINNPFFLKTMSSKSSSSSSSSPSSSKKSDNKIEDLSDIVHDIYLNSGGGYDPNFSPKCLMKKQKKNISHSSSSSLSSIRRKKDFFAIRGNIPQTLCFEFRENVVITKILVKVVGIQNIHIISLQNRKILLNEGSLVMNKKVNHRNSYSSNNNNNNHNGQSVFSLEPIMSPLSNQSLENNDYNNFENKNIENNNENYDLLNRKDEGKKNYNNINILPNSKQNIKQQKLNSSFQSQSSVVLPMLPKNTPSKTKSQSHEHIISNQNIHQTTNQNHHNNNPHHPSNTSPFRRSPVRHLSWSPQLHHKTPNSSLNSSLSLGLPSSSSSSSSSLSSSSNSYVTALASVGLMREGFNDSSSSSPNIHVNTPLSTSSSSSSSSFQKGINFLEFNQSTSTSTSTLTSKGKEEPRQQQQSISRSSEALFHKFVPMNGCVAFVIENSPYQDFGAIIDVTFEGIKIQNW